MDRRPIAVAMIGATVLASGCVSRRTFVAEQQRTATLGLRASSLDRQLTESRRSLERVTAERDRLAGERQQQEARAEALAAELEAARRDVEARRGEIEAARRDLEAARRDLDAARQALERTQGDLTATERQLERTQGEQATAQQELERAQGRLATAQQELAATVEARDRLAAERADLEARERNLTAALSRAGQALDETRSRAEATRQDLARTAGERDRIAAERERLDAEARDLAAQLSATRDQLGATTGERDTARQEADATRQELETARGELAATREALARARDEAASVERALSGTQGELTSARQSLGATREELAARERNLKEAIAAYDKLVEDLRQEIGEGQVQISRLRDRLTVRVLDRILFDSGSARIKASGQEVLRKVADTVRTLPDQEVHIEGHTDNVPIKESYRHVFATNWELSAARATGVARFLQEKATVDPKGLAAVGYGEYRPVQPNDTEEGRAQNRRIEIVLVPRDAEAAAR